MQNEPTPAEGKDSAQTESESALRGAACSALEFLAQELDMPAKHVREAARAIGHKRLTEAANDLHAAFFVMLRDWKDGDFNLPPLARIHMEAMECKAIELGKLLFRQNDQSSATGGAQKP